MCGQGATRMEELEDSARLEPTRSRGVSEAHVGGASQPRPSKLAKGGPAVDFNGLLCTLPSLMAGAASGSLSAGKNHCKDLELNHFDGLREKEEAAGGSG